MDSRSRAAQPPQRSCRPSPSELLLEPRSPLCTEPLPLPEPLRAAPGAAQPPPRSRRPSPSELLRVPPGPPCALQPLGSSAHSPGAQCPRPPGSCSNSLRAPFRPGRLVQLLLLRGGAADPLSSGQERPCCLVPPGLCLSRREAGSWAVSRRPVLPGLRCWIRAPAPQPPPRSRPRAPRAAPAPQPPPRSRPRAPQLLRVPPPALQPLGSSAHSPGAQVPVSVPGSPRASPPSWVLLHLPGAPFCPGRLVQLLLL